jgi:lipopolysaccharide export LptBFGC system permease protein LptF
MVQLTKVLNYGISIILTLIAAYQLWMFFSTGMKNWILLAYVVLPLLFVAMFIYGLVIENKAKSQTHNAIYSEIQKQGKILTSLSPEEINEMLNQSKLNIVEENKDGKSDGSKN